MCNIMALCRLARLFGEKPDGNYIDVVDLWLCWQSLTNSTRLRISPFVTARGVFVDGRLSVHTRVFYFLPPLLSFVSVCVWRGVSGLRRFVFRQDLVLLGLTGTKRGRFCYFFYPLFACERYPGHPVYVLAVCSVFVNASCRFVYTPPSPFKKL